MQVYRWGVQMTTSILHRATGIVLVVLGVVLVVELVFLAVGVIVWARTPDDRMPRPNKWVWLVLILFVQIIGPVAFLFARRSEARYAVAAEPEAKHGAVAPRRTAADTADLLYGKPEDGK